MNDEATANGSLEDAELNRYAAVLRTTQALALPVLVGGYLLYLTGVLPSIVPPATALVDSGRASAAFVAACGEPTGWAWLARLGHGDMLCLLGIALLGVSPILALLAILPLAVRRRDRAFVMVLVAQVAVLVAAAAGWLGRG